MKKVFLLALISVMVSGSFAQGCLGDVWQSLQNNKIMEAKKKIDECMPGNEESAKAWLYKGNVYLRIHNQDDERLKKNPAYVSKNPDAILTAYESFYKALEINPKLDAVDGLLSATEGQVLCGETIYKRGIAANQANDSINAEKYFRIAVKCFNLDPAYKQYLGWVYNDLAIVTKKLKGDTAYKEILEEAVNANTDRVQIYLALFQIYQNENDAEKCSSLIKKGKKYVAPKDQTNIYFMELSYWSSIGDTTNLNITVNDISKKFDTVPAIISEAATYLIDAKQYSKASELLNKSLLLKPNDFTLNNMMAYCYYMRANDFISTRNQAIKDRNYELANEYKTKQDSCLNTAHDWAEKAYQINPRDLGNAKILKQLKLQLAKEVPAELNAIIQELSPAKPE